MEKYILIKPDSTYLDEIKSYREEFLSADSSMDGAGPLRRMADSNEWLNFNKLMENDETLIDGLVRQTQYAYVRLSDNRIVGMIQIRHYLNDYLRKYAGHIGYSVRPSERRKGYANEMLKLVLEECRKVDLKEILITCKDNNTGSRKTILHNGGVYESTVYEEDEMINLERYWIKFD